MPPTIGILSSQRGHHVLSLEEAIRNRGCKPAFFPTTRMAGWIGKSPALQVRGECVEDCQALLVRTIPSGSLEEIIFRVDALHRLEGLGVRVINSASAIERTVDKYYTSFMLADGGIPTPRTLVTEDFEGALAACGEIGDVVIKPLFGSEGKGMVRVTDQDTAYRVLRAWELNKYIYYIQEYIPHSQQDIRAFVVGNEVVAAMLRRGKGWRTNFSQGAEVEPTELSPEMQSLAIKAARLIKLDYAGVDLIPAEDGRNYVLEVNGIPGWRGLQKTTGHNIAQRIVDYALDFLDPCRPGRTEPRPSGRGSP
jgi:RimK family alpha-L-glutamate ligase